MKALRCVITAITSSILIVSVASAQFSPIEYQMGRIAKREVGPVIDKIKAEGNYLKPSSVLAKLDSALNHVVKLRLTNPYHKTLDGPEIYNRLKQSTIVLVGASIRASGFIIGPDGVCVTNYHVMKRFSDTSDRQLPLLAMTADRTFYPVTGILSCSKINDIAIIKIDTRGVPLVPLPLGKTAEEGSEVFVMGHPAHILYYMTKGIVAKNFIMHPGGLRDNEQARMAVTADYSLGESGGPIVNNECNIVGMVSSASALYGNPRAKSNPQMVVKSAIPVIAIRQLITIRLHHSTMP